MSTPPAPADPVVRSTFSSRDEGEVADFVGRMYAENSSYLSAAHGSARFAARTHDVPAIGSDRVRTTLDYGGVFEQGFDDYVFFVVHSGRLRVTTRAGDMRVTEGDAAFYPLGLPVRFAMRPFDVTTLRLAAARVAALAEHLTGVPADRFRFLSTEPVSPAMRRHWRDVVVLAQRTLSDPGSTHLPPLLGEELARSAVVAALHAFPSVSTVRHHAPAPGDVAPASLRRAVAHIEEHAAEPVRIEDIAAAAGTSARALQYAFRRHLDTTPLGHLRRVRLDHARRELRDADPARGGTVAEVAARWGFAHTGRFAAAYRAAFGESPATTLRR